MHSLKPFFSYYGGKWRIAPKYPQPRYATIVEPFAGSAGYSLRHFYKKVILADISEIICGVWDYLIRVKESEILSLPDVRTSIEELNICQEAKWLIGFSLNNATSTPCNRPSRWMKRRPDSASFWNVKKRERIASQLYAIRHWKVHHASYRQLDNVRVTWFVDPPYQYAGGHRYPESSINYDDLGAWCRNLDGQVIVCEGRRARWLPFRTFITTGKATNRHHKNTASKERIYTVNCWECRHEQ